MWKGLVRAGVLEDEQVVGLDEGDGDAIGQQRVDEVVGQLAHGTVEEAHQVVAGMETVEALVLLDENAVTKPILLSEDDRLGQLPERFVDLGVGKCRPRAGRSWVGRRRCQHASSDLAVAASYR